MINLFKDRYKLAVAFAALFLIGILASVYQIYRLPNNLMLSDGYHPALSGFYFVVGATFLLGAFTVWFMLNYQNEVIVFRDKQLKNDNDAKESSETEKSVISLDLVKDTLKQVRNEKEIIQAGLQAICRQLDAGQGAAYLLQEEDNRKKLELRSGYALNMSENTVISYEVGEGLIGQAAVAGKTLYIDDVPEGYVKILSGLGSSSPRYLLIVAIKDQDKVKGILELASFTPLNEHQRKFAEDSAQLIGDKISGRA